MAPLLVPGLLQTADYARAVLGEGPDIQRRVDLRVERAEILTRPRNPAALRAFVHTEALARPVAPAEVMRAQMRHLLRMAELPNVIIQTGQDTSCVELAHRGLVRDSKNLDGPALPVDLGPLLDAVKGDRVGH